MALSIKELRDSTGMTQKAFAQMYEIPVSTLRKWEQGEASPPQYVVNLIAETLPIKDNGWQEITGKQGEVYYYDKQHKMVSDKQGNKIFIQEDLEGVNEQNLAVYLQDLFEDFYEIRERFQRDCHYDGEENILWS
jgi:transcriptional regulator with XRE-family HTH domain